MILSFFQSAAARPLTALQVKKLLPLFDRVLVQRAEAVTKTESGIVIPEKAQSKVLQGTVVAVGPGSRNPEGKIIPLNIKVSNHFFIELADVHLLI